MFNYRKKTRDALVSALSDATNGFNAQIGAIAAEYGITAFELNFGADSRNVIYGYLEDDEVAISRIEEFPGAVIYTTEAIDENRPNRSKFFVAGQIAIYNRLRLLDDVDSGANQPDFSNDYEKWPDAFEHAMAEALHAGRSIMGPLGVNYTLYRADRDPITSTGDGHIQRLTFTLGFEVHL